MSRPPRPRISRENRRARFKFELLDRYEAGMVLRGTEVKAIREGSVSIDEAYCRMRRGEVFVIGMNIAPYSHGGRANHEPTRERKLLLRRAEIERLAAKVRQKGFTLVPTRLYENERGVFKLEIALARGKRKYDRREEIRRREGERRMRGWQSRRKR